MLARFPVTILFFQEVNVIRFQLLQIYTEHWQSTLKKSCSMLHEKKKKKGSSTTQQHFI